VTLHGDRLCVLYTNVGDQPEAILRTWIDLNLPWKRWRAEPAIPVLQPEHDYEGAEEELTPSIRGLVVGPANQLRDPAILIDDDEAFLFYAIAGEYGIAGARIDSWD